MTLRYNGLCHIETDLDDMLHNHKENTLTNHTPKYNN